MEGKSVERDELAIAPEAERAAAPSVAEGGTPVEGSSLSQEQLEQMTADIVGALKTVYDPEIPADIYELGLIYKIEIDDDRNVEVEIAHSGELPEGLRQPLQGDAAGGGSRLHGGCGGCGSRHRVLLWIIVERGKVC